MPGIRLGYNFLPFPMEIVDEALDLTLNEYRLLGYLLRHQLRLGKAVMRMKQDDVLRGRKMPDGSRIDKGSGIRCARDLVKARNLLIDREWLTAISTDSGMEYELQISPDEPQVQNAPEVQNATCLGAKCTNKKCKMHQTYKEEDKSKEGQEIRTNQEPMIGEVGSLFQGEPEAKLSKKAVENLREQIVEEVHAYYIETLELRPNTNTITEKKRTAGRMAFDVCIKMAKDHTPEQAKVLMESCVDSLSNSDWHTGRDPKTKNKKYLDWARHLFPNEDKVQWWVNRNLEGQ